MFPVIIDDSDLRNCPTADFDLKASCIGIADDQNFNEESLNDAGDKRHARATRKEEKVRIALSGLRGEDSIVELCRKEGGGWAAKPLSFLAQGAPGGGKKRLAGNTAGQANTAEIKSLRAEALAMKELVVDLSLENRLLKTGAGPIG